MNVTMSESPHPIIQARRAQMFPTLAPTDIDRLRRFGETRSYGSGERIIRAGNVAPGLIVILSGKVEVTQGRGLDRREIIVTHAETIRGRTGTALRPSVARGRRGP
jgi:thioredoxin reductase (NADPH)